MNKLKNVLLNNNPTMHLIIHNHSYNNHNYPKIKIKMNRSKLMMMKMTTLIIKIIMQM